MSYIVYIGESVVHSTDGPEILFTNGETADSSPFDQPGRPIRRRAFSIFYDQLLIVGRGASHRLRRKQLSSRTAARPSIEVQLRGRRVGANGGTAVIGFDYTEPLESQANRKAFRAPFVSLHFRRLLVVVQLFALGKPVGNAPHENHQLFFFFSHQPTLSKRLLFSSLGSFPSRRLIRSVGQQGPLYTREPPLPLIAPVRPLTKATRWKPIVRLIL